MEASVAAMFADTNKRKDLFNIWLQHAKDFGRVQLEVSRRNTQQQSAHCNTVTWSKAQLEQSGRYTKEDIDDLIARAEKHKRYIDDPNFPGVERLRRYYLVDEVGSQKKNLQEDIQQLNNVGDVTNQEAQALSGQGQKYHLPKKEFEQIFKQPSVSYFAKTKAKRFSGSQVFT